jgi:hypothetical protein
MPITHTELNAYRESPETFFGVYDPQTKAEHPVELYESILSVYRSTSRERLLELMTGHPSIGIFPRRATIRTRQDICRRDRHKYFKGD